MKKILFLLLCTVSIYGQTYQNPTFGTVKTKTAPTVTTTPHLGTVETDGTISKITPANLPVSTATKDSINTKIASNAGLQNAYNFEPGIITSAIKGAVTVQEGTGTDTNNVLVGKNNAGTTTFSVTGEGKTKTTSTELADNPIGSVANEIKQTIGVNDWWKIYGKIDVSDRSEMVLEVGDNAVPFSANGQRFRFHYNASSEGVEKSPFIIDYNEVTADANFTAKSIINSTAPATNALLANGTTLANPISGSLSIGIIPKATGANSLGNSLITDSGTDVGVNGTFNNLSFVQNQLGIFSMGANSRTGVEIGSNMSATNTTNGVLAFTSQQSTETNKTLVSIASKTGSNVSSGILSFSTANAGVLSEKAFLHPSGGFSVGNTIDRGAGVISATSYSGGATLTGTPTAPTATAGTNTTQIATTAFVQSATRPYKVYTALISQTGTSAPTAIVLENTLGGTVVWTRTASGQYLATLSGAFTVDKTVPIISATSVSYMFASKPNSINNLVVHTALESTGGFGDGYLVNTPIEIRVYN